MSVDNDNTNRDDKNKISPYNQIPIQSNNNIQYELVNTLKTFKRAKSVSKIVNFTDKNCLSANS